MWRPKMDEIELVSYHTFSVDVKASSGKTYEGSFTTHRPTVGEIVEMEMIESRELGGMKNVSKVESNLARMLSVLDVIIDSSPEWWKPRKLEDLEVVQVVYEKYINYLREFQRQVRFEGESQGGF